MVRTAAVVLGLVLAVGFTAAARAEEAAAESAWEFEVAPYAWIPGNFIRGDVHGRSINAAVSVHDVLDLTTSGNAMAAGGYASARYERFFLLLDAFGGYAEESVDETASRNRLSLTTTVKGEFRFAFMDFAVGYQVGRWPMPARRRPVSLGVYAGVRYAHLGTEVNAAFQLVGPLGRALEFNREVSSTSNFADPIIGLEWEVPVLDTLSIDFRGDIGGFHASSDLTWGLVGGVRYWMPWNPCSLHPWVSAGYKALSWDRDPGRDATITMDFRGPYAALGFTF